MSSDVVTVERVIAAPPEAIFELLADPAKHPLIDGSGAVEAAKDGGGGRLTLGSTFGMSMRAGLPYSMVNTVIEYEENRRITWQTRAPGLAGSIVGGRIWRYELERVDGGTRVRESWDITKDRQRLGLRLLGFPARTRENMEKTLERIAQLVE
ncbi:MAG TPA: SRPBCC family protein [Acidimicrobiales bacterium]